MAETSKSEQEQEPELELPVQPEEISPEEIARRRNEERWLRNFTDDPGHEFGRGVDNWLYLAEDVHDDRKMKLFLCDCFRRIQDSFPDVVKESIDIIERSIEEPVTEQEINTVVENIQSIINRLGNTSLDISSLIAMRDIFEGDLRDSTISLFSSTLPEIYNNEDRVKTLKEIFGNPFAKEPIELDPRWLSSTVLDLAKTIYEEKVFERMPILADALMDAGCDNEEIISHCQKSDCQHVRGCWVLDLLLRKEKLQQEPQQENETE